MSRGKETTVYLFQSPPKGPTIPYKAVQYSVPPPSSATSVTSLQESSATSSYASPPPCNPIHMEPMPLMSPLFSPTPLMSPGYPLGPCVRYTAVPLNPSMFPLMHGAPEPKPIYCQQPLEASFKLWKNIYVIFPSPKFKDFGSGRYSLNPASRPNLTMPSFFLYTSLLFLSLFSHFHLILFILFPFFLCSNPFPLGYCVALA